MPGAGSGSRGSSTRLPRGCRSTPRRGTSRVSLLSWRSSPVRCWSVPRCESFRWQRGANIEIRATTLYAAARQRGRRAKRGVCATTLYAARRWGRRAKLGVCATTLYAARRWGRRAKLGARATIRYAARQRGRRAKGGARATTLYAARRWGRRAKLGVRATTLYAARWVRAEPGLRGNDPIRGTATIAAAECRVRVAPAGPWWGSAWGLAFGSTQLGRNLEAGRGREPPRTVRDTGDRGLGRAAGGAAGDLGDARWGSCATTLYAGGRTGSGGWGEPVGGRLGDQGDKGGAASSSLTLVASRLDLSRLARARCGGRGSGGPFYRR